MVMIGNVGRLLFLLAMLVALMAFQAFLSLKRGRRAGLILPMISFLISLFSGVYIMVSAGASVSEVAGITILTLLLHNILTILLLAVYAVCRIARRNQDRKQQLNKMNIQDL